MRFYAERMKIVVEPTGALSLAAIHAGLPLKGKRVGIVISGGNVDLQLLPACCPTEGENKRCCGMLRISSNSCLQAGCSHKRACRFSTQRPRT